MMGWFFDTLVWSGLLIAVVLVLRRPVARFFGAGMAYALWLLPLLRLFMPPLILPTAAPARVAPVQSSEIVTLTVAEPVAPALALPWELLLTSAWLGGAALFLIARALEYREMRARLLAAAVTVDQREGVRIVETPLVDGPVAFGLRDKVIALPKRFLISGALAERELSIEHELAHHRGRDLLANILAQGVLALHWFNPLAWAAWAAMRRDQEAACDARAMAGRDLPTRAAYARVIAGFASAQRLNSSNFGGAALAAPMACPVLGDKSIIHRLRSLTMSDISPRRRRAARWLLGAGTALALPLTATVVYAGHDVPEPPAVPAAPQAPQAPASPEAPEAPKVVKEVIVIHEDASDVDRPDRHDKDAKFERRIERDGKTIVLRSDRPFDEAELEAKLAQMETRMAELGDLEASEKGGEGPRTMILRRHLAPGEAPHAPAIAFSGKNCAPGKGTQVEAMADENGERQVVRIALCHAGANRDLALKSVREARDSIANDSGMGAEVRAKVLQQLDASIARIEKDAKW